MLATALRTALVAAAVARRALATECSACPAGTRPQRNATGTLCVPCPPGSSSIPGDDSCTPCPAGTYASAAGSPTCKPCPLFSTSFGEGNTGCYACLENYYRTPFAQGGVRCDNDTALERQCADDSMECFDRCCLRCDGVLGTESCPAAGYNLSTLPLKAGWWRATELETQTYRCFYPETCRGAQPNTSSFGDGLCAPGHEGPLCTVCERNYYWSGAELKCEKCKTRGGAVALMVCMILVVALVLFVALSVMVCPEKTVFKAALEMMTMGCGRCGSVGQAAAKLAAEESAQPPDGEAEVAPDLASEEVEPVPLDNDPVARAIVEHLRETEVAPDSSSEDEAKPSVRVDEEKTTYFFSKLKIVIGCYQVVWGLLVLFPDIHWPISYRKLARVFGFASLDISGVTNTACILPWYDYIYQMIVATTWPLFLRLMAFVAFSIIRDKVSSGSRWRDPSTWFYFAFLAIYFEYSSASSKVLRYFNCVEFDARGQDPSTLKVLMADMSISCRSDRYQNFMIFAWVMVFVWPIGFPLFCASLLCWYRRLINPKMRHDEEHDEEHRGVLRLASYQLMEMGLDQRAEEERLKSMKFLFEEYQPRCWWFAIAELIHRLYLTGLIAFFGSDNVPTTTTQVSLGLLGAMVYYAVIATFNPYLSAEDDFLAKVARAQVILTFYMATMIQADQVSPKALGDPKQIFSSKVFDAISVLVGITSISLYVFMLLRPYRESAKKAASSAKQYLNYRSAPDRNSEAAVPGDGAVSADPAERSPAASSESKQSDSDA